jgi:hypothetical protein
MVSINIWKNVLVEHNVSYIPIQKWKKKQIAELFILISVYYFL